MSEVIIPEEILLGSRMVLNNLASVNSILSSSIAEEQNQVIANQLNILENLYIISTITKGIRSAISETYFQYFRRARELYVISLNLGLKDSEVDEDTLHYKIIDDSLSIEVYGMFNELLTKEFLQPEIISTIFGLGFLKITVINPKSGFTKLVNGYNLNHQNL